MRAGRGLYGPRRRLRLLVRPSLKHASRVTALPISVAADPLAVACHPVVARESVERADATAQGTSEAGAP